MMIVHYELFVAGCLFALVAIAHLLRLIYKTEVMIGSVSLPMWVSVWGVIIPALLAAWMFMSGISAA
jgi:hypothetical protein